MYLDTIWWTSGELAAAWQYLDQRYNMPDDRGKALLTDIGTEEFAHVEIISAMLYQLMDRGNNRGA